ncbi:Ran-binding protein [Acrasis kona]|uniref:Ran-binding protein n=1 Tax=Acrasis kona TaxID=1008807 RepID=A0AAW2Z242_9EUKA
MKSAIKVVRSLPGGKSYVIQWKIFPWSLIPRAAVHVPYMSSQFALFGNTWTFATLTTGGDDGLFPVVILPINANFTPMKIHLSVKLVHPYDPTLSVQRPIQNNVEFDTNDNNFYGTYFFQVKKVEDFIEHDTLLIEVGMTIEEELTEDIIELFVGELYERDREQTFYTKFPTNVLHSNCALYDTNKRRFFTNDPKLFTTQNNTTSFGMIVQFEVPPNQLHHGIIYFEAKVIRYGVDFGVGLAKLGYNGGMVGWSESSIGFHADDGYVFDDSSVYSQTTYHLKSYDVGDVVGLMYNLKTGLIEFRVNGVLIEAKSREGALLNNFNMYRSACLDLLPSITSHPQSCFEVNFGQDNVNQPLSWSGYFDLVSTQRSNMLNLQRKAQLTDVIFK